MLRRTSRADAQPRSNRGFNHSPFSERTDCAADHAAARIDVEYVAASNMLFEGMVKEGFGLIGAVRSRYDGRKRISFNEADWGHHYSRAMAA
jgi:hypothetical protein